MIRFNKRMILDRITKKINRGMIAGCILGLTVPPTREKMLVTTRIGIGQPRTTITGCFDWRRRVALMSMDFLRASFAYAFCGSRSEWG